MHMYIFMYIYMHIYVHIYMSNPQNMRYINSN